jgi:hypothetical protein
MSEDIRSEHEMKAFLLKTVNCIRAWRLWLLWGALIVFLVWSLGEIEICLYKTAAYSPLLALFFIVAAPTAVAIAVGPPETGGSDPESSSLPSRRDIRRLLLLNIATIVLAVTTAQALNAAYRFKTPLLNLSARLMSQLCRLWR